MPGIIGRVSARDTEGGALDSLERPMLHRSDYRISRLSAPGFAAAGIDLASAKQVSLARDPTTQSSLLFFGMLYEDWIDDPKTTAAALLARWNEKGESALVDLNGEYLICAWEGRSRRLILTNDRLGLKRLYLRSAGESLLWASELKSLALATDAPAAAINEAAIAELLCFGHLQGTHTILQGIRTLPAASLLVWDNGTEHVERYWKPRFRTNRIFENHTTAVDTYFEVVSDCVRRRVDRLPSLGLLLSGGLDARSIAGIMRKVAPERPLHTWVTGHAHAHDVRFAAKIARRIGSRHEAIDIPPDFVGRFGGPYSWILDGSASVTAAHRLCALEPAARSVEALACGFLGDILSGGKPFDKLIEITDERLLAETGFAIYAVGCSEATLRTLLPEPTYARIRGRAFEAFRARVEEADVEYPADRVVYAELMERQRLWNPIVQMDLMGSQIIPCTPFADKQFLDFALSLPMSQRFQKEAYIGMIAKHLRPLARVPRSGGGLPIVCSRARASLHWRWVLFRRHRLRGLSLGLYTPHDHASYVHCGPWMRASSAGFIRETLIDNPLLAQTFDMDGVRRLVEGFIDGSAKEDPTEAVGSLLALALFLGRLHARAETAPSAAAPNPEG